MSASFRVMTSCLTASVNSGTSLLTSFTAPLTSWRLILCAFAASPWVTGGELSNFRQFSLILGGRPGLQLGNSSAKARVFLLLDRSRLSPFFAQT